MNTRICSLCRTEKPLDEFQKDKSKPLGRAYWCKPCRRAFDRIRNHRLDRRLAIAQWEKSERGKASRAHRLKTGESGLKYKVRMSLREQVRNGSIKRLPCEICGKEQGQGHHPDYSKPFDVTWLCQKHHSELHHQLETALATK